jgi:hypothetical protein
LFVSQTGRIKEEAMPDSVCVRVFPTRAEAQLAKEILEDIDIRASIEDEGEAGSEEDDRTAGHVKLMVSPGDAAHARSVLRGASKV